MTSNKLDARMRELVNSCDVDYDAYRDDFPADFDDFDILVATAISKKPYAASVMLSVFDELAGMHTADDVVNVLKYITFAVHQIAQHDGYPPADLAEHTRSVTTRLLDFDF